MKKLICALLALAMVASLCACTNILVAPDASQEVLGTSAPATDSNEDSTTTPESTPAGSEKVPYVVDAVNEQFQGAYDATYTVKLPKIVLSNPNIDAINAQILEDFSNCIAKEEETATALFSNVSYRWGMKGDVLSVVVFGGSSFYCNNFDDNDYDFGCNNPMVYNISISECRLMSNEEVYAASGMENVKTRVLHAITCYGSEWRGRTEDSIAIFYGSADAYPICNSEELTDENFNSAVPYFNEDGKLCVMGTVHTAIGVGVFRGFVCVEDYYTDSLYTLEEYYSYYYNLYN